MPYDPNANWTAKTNAGAFGPVYYIAIDGLASKHYSTAPVLSAGTTKRVLLQFPGIIGQKANPLTGRVSLNLFEVRLVNEADEANDLFGTERSSPTLDTLINRRVTLYAGYYDLAEADYAKYGVGQIRGVSFDALGTTMIFGLGDLRRAANDTIFLNADAGDVQQELQLVADTAASVSVVVVTGDPTAFSEGDRIFIGPSTHGSYLGDEEKVTVQQVRDDTNEMFFTPALSSLYKAGDSVRAASTRIVGNPYNMMLAVMTGDFNNVNWPLVLVTGQPTGMGIASADIDTAAIYKERDRMYPSSIWRMDIARPISGVRFLSDFLFRHLGFPTMTRDGRVSFKSFRPVFPDDVATMPTITEADVITWEAWRDVESHVNRVVLGVDTALGGGDPTTTITVEDTADQALTDEQSEIREEDTLFTDQSSYSGSRLAAGRASALLRRLGDGPYQIPVMVGAWKRAISLGDDILLTHSQIPNPGSASPGLTAKRLEVVGLDEDLERGFIKLLLQDGNWTRPGWIGASGAVPGYDSASATEREYAYIGPSGSPVGNFSDGTPPYEIQ